MLLCASTVVDPSRCPPVSTISLVQKPWGCFSCASPFSCKQQRRGAGADSDDDEVVRRATDSTEGFVIRRKHSFASLSPASVAREEHDGGGANSGTADRLK